MTAALELAGVSPELLEALTEHIAAKLALVPPPAAALPEAEGLSMLPASVRRRACERRQRDAARAKRSPEAIPGLSDLPGSVRTREYRRRLAAAKNGGIASIDRPALDLQPVNTEKSNSRRGPSDRSQRGPLAGDLAQIVDRVSGYAESNPKRDRVWLYREASRIFREDLGLRLPETWSGPKDWGAAKVLVRDWPREQLLEAIHATCATWRLSPTWSRPTLGLVLFQLRRDHPAPAPAPRSDPRRMTGAALEQLEMERARRASVPSPPPPAETPARREARPTPAPTGSLQIAEPSPATSAEAQAVLELVNATAERCRAFRGRP